MREIKKKIIQILDQQEEKGISTYGEPLESADIDPETGEPYDWNMMTIEELVDALQYQVKENIELHHENAHLNHELGVAENVVNELSHDLDVCDDKVREMLYNDDEDGKSFT